MRLVGLTEIGEMFGVSRQRAGQIADKKNFPKRIDDPPLAMGPVWKHATVERWAKTNRKEPEQ